jgi:hypothetical protein
MVARQAPGVVEWLRHIANVLPMVYAASAADRQIEAARHALCDQVGIAARSVEVSA